mgnify:CR=1 FL=1
MAPEERNAFLAAMDAEPVVREAALRLLDAHYAGSLLETLTLLEPETVPKSAPHRRFRDGEIVAQRYRIRRFLGAGGMGEVYEADDEKLQQRMALR